MSPWLIDSLNKRVEFLIGNESPAPTGGAKLTYEPKAKVWAGLEAIKMARRGGGSAYYRDVQVEDEATHIIRVRKNVGYGIHADHDGLIKANNFIYLMSSLKKNQGRLFRILAHTEVSSTGIGEDYYYDIMVREMGSLDRGSGIIS